MKSGIDSPETSLCTGLMDRMLLTLFESSHLRGQVHSTAVSGAPLHLGMTPDEGQNFTPHRAR